MVKPHGRLLRRQTLVFKCFFLREPSYLLRATSTTTCWTNHLLGYWLISLTSLIASHDCWRINTVGETWTSVSWTMIPSLQTLEDQHWAQTWRRCTCLWGPLMTLCSYDAGWTQMKSLSHSCQNRTDLCDLKWQKKKQNKIKFRTLGLVDTV